MSKDPCGITALHFVVKVNSPTTVGNTGSPNMEDAILIYSEQDRAHSQAQDPVHYTKANSVQACGDKEEGKYKKWTGLKYS